jgi:hypothetical protein
MCSPQLLLSGFGTLNIPTNSEFLLGSFSWIGQIQGTFSKGKNTNYKATTTIVSYAITMLKRRLSTSSLAALSVRLAGDSWNLTSDFFQMMMQAKQQLRNPFFMEIFTIASWHIWKQRNNFIFDRGRPSFISWKISFYEEAKLQAFRLCEEK